MASHEVKDLRTISPKRFCQHTAIRRACEHPDRLFCTDQLRKAYELIGRGKDDRQWRGRLMRELAKAGIFEQVGYERSSHPGRGSRPMMWWKLSAETGDLLKWMDQHPLQTMEASQQTLFDI